MKRLTPEIVERWLERALWLLVVLVVVSAFILIKPPPGFPNALFITMLGLALPAFSFAAKRFGWKNPLLLTLVNVAIVSAVFLLTGGVNGSGYVLIFPTLGLGAIRLTLRRALGAAALAGLIFSYHLFVPPSDPSFTSNMIMLADAMLTFFGVVFIFNFLVAAQRQAQLRRERETALDEARRLRDQQAALALLSREITDGASLEQILQTVLTAVRKFIPFRGGSVALIDPQQRLFIAASSRPVDATVKALRLPLGSGIAGWIASNQLPFYSPDLDRETVVPPAFRNIGGNAELKSYLGVPLLTKGHCIGVLEVDSPQPDAFTPDHQRLLETVATQVSGSIENVQLLQEQRELSRRLDTIYNTINSLTSEFDLELIMRELALTARDLLDVRYAVAATLDERGQSADLVPVGFTEEELRAFSDPPSGNGLLRQMAGWPSPLRLDDLDQFPAAQGYISDRVPLHSFLSVPMPARGEWLGTLFVADKNNGELFGDSDKELLKTLAAGAAAAISNARLYERLRQNIEQLYVLHQIGQAISSSLSLEEVIHVFNLDVRRLCHAETCIVSQWNPNADTLVKLDRSGADDVRALRERPVLYKQLLEAARSAQPVAFSLHTTDGSMTRVYSHVAPLIVRGRVIGLAEIYSHSPSMLSPESCSLFLTLAAQLAIGIENARLYSELQKREEQLRHFVGVLFHAQEEERRHMAYDIHDGLAQMIVSADIHMNNFVSLESEAPELANEELQKGLKTLKAVLTEVRRVVSQLRPSTLDDFGLINTLRRDAEQLARDQGWKLEFDENLGDLRLDPTIETGAYRLVQEALSNARKYSETDRVAIELKQDGQFLSIQVQDWGKGFDLDEARLRAGHVGIAGMEERARLLGGRCEILTAPGKGTTVRVQLTLRLALPIGPTHVQEQSSEVR